MVTNMRLVLQQALTKRQYVEYAVFPRRCGLCATVIAPKFTVCNNCRDNLPVVPDPVCLLCGAQKDSCFCGSTQQVYYQGMVAPFYYTGPVRQGIHQMKFHNRPQNAAFFADCMAQAAQQRYPKQEFDLAACIPMTEKEEQARGYNQSSLLAEHVAKALQITCVPDLLAKIAETASQRELDPAQRKVNVLDAFAVHSPEQVQDKTVLLCDDVKTTGATLNECAKALCQAGAAAIYCVSAAITPMPNEE